MSSILTLPSLPSLFLSHAVPFLLARDEQLKRTLGDLGTRLAPKAVLVVNAHWETEAPTVGRLLGVGMADASAMLALRVARQLGAAGIGAVGFDVPDSGAPGSGAPIQALGGHVFYHDHALWTPLSLLFPHGPPAVATLSIQPGLTPAHHYAVGRALRALRQQGVLLIGSGSLTHNHQDVRPQMPAGQALPWAASFVDWITERVNAADTAALLNYRQLAPFARHSHPQEDHLLPFFVALGAGAPARGERLHHGFAMGTISLAAFLFP
ncbi:MAG: class III extradiol ring-cleavage dioxygenase [Pseudomonadota bacterium]